MVFHRKWLIFVILFFIAGRVVAEPKATVAFKKKDGAAKKPTTVLGVRQERVKQTMLDLEHKLKSLASTLSKSEPDQAKRLSKALHQSKQALVTGRMDEIARLLHKARFDSATDEQKKIIRELQKLLEILAEDEKDNLPEEVAEVETIREKINILIEKENDHKRQTEIAEDKPGAIADLDAKIALVKRLIQLQKSVLGKTRQARTEGIQGLGPVASQQRSVRQQTEQVADQISQASDSSAEGGESKGSESKSGESKSGESKGGESKGGESKGGESKGGESKGGESKSGESKGGESKGGESKGGESKGGESKGGETPTGEKKQEPPKGSSNPGEKPIRNAIESQKSAERNLGQGKGKAAENNQAGAVAKLNETLKELEEERSRIVSLPPEILEQLAKKQDKTADKAGKLAGEMAGKPQPGGDPSGDPQPGTQEMNQAQQAMKNASDQLRKKNPRQAAGDQDEAIEKLKKARQAIEDRLAQLRKEMQIEFLAALEAQFRAMLERQKPVTIGTTALEKKRASSKLLRADHLTISEYAKQEHQLSQLAQQALDIIIEDGTSVVFPKIVEQLREDLEIASELLSAQRTGNFTQSLQKEIESTLEELIKALEEAQKKAEAEGEGGESGSGPQDNPPLLPNSAELKLLKSTQLRVNRLTTEFNKARSPDKLNEVMERAIKKISARQFDAAAMAEEMIERY